MSDSSSSQIAPDVSKQQSVYSNNFPRPVPIAQQSDSHRKLTSDYSSPSSQSRKLRGNGSTSTIGQAPLPLTDPDPGLLENLLDDFSNDRRVKNDDLSPGGTLGRVTVGIGGHIGHMGQIGPMGPVGHGGGHAGLNRHFKSVGSNNNNNNNNQMRYDR